MNILTQNARQILPHKMDHSEVSSIEEASRAHRGVGGHVISTSKCRTSFDTYEHE